MFDEYFDEYEMRNVQTVTAAQKRAVKKALARRIGTQTRTGSVSRRAVIIPIAAVMIAAGTVTAGAAGIELLASRFFDNSEMAREMTISGIFHDEDGNVSVDVDELISDGMDTYISLHYTAITDEGKEWLDKYELEYKHAAAEYMLPQGNSMHLWPATFADGNYTFKGAWSYYSFELENMRTEDKRYFMAQIDFSQRDTVGDEILLYYPMTDSEREKMINIAGFCKERLFKINAETDSEKYYVPTYLRVSQISYTLYGNIIRDGIYKKSGNSEWLDLPRDEHEDLVSNTYLVTKDGRKLDCLSAAGPVEPAEENNFSNFCLMSGLYTDHDTKEPVFADGSRIIIDPDDIVGIQIEDKYYSFVD